jgi:beta-phosphoglucomutase-like phosphatase (HAD superfamily)
MTLQALVAAHGTDTRRHKLVGDVHLILLNPAGEVLFGHPAIYLLTAAKIGVPAADCIFVDDTAANLPAARDLGMATVHFTDAEAGVAEIEQMLGIA